MVDQETVQSLSENALVAGAFIESRLATNLSYFKEHLPDIYDLYSNYSEQRYFLIYDNDGNINVMDRDQGELLYDENPIQQVLDNFSQYQKSPICRPYIFFSDNSSDSNKKHVHNDALTGLGVAQKKLFEGASKGIVEKLVAASEQERVTGFSEFDLPKDINTMSFFSVGLGFDLEKLCLEYEIRNLFVVEPNLDMFYCSMQLIDWAGMLQRIKDLGHSVYIGLSEDYKYLVRDFSLALAKHGRHNAAGTYLYSGFYLPEYKEVFESFKKELELSIFAGFGFYDDSRNSVAHTVANFEQSVPCIKSDKEINKEFNQRDLPVFLIGNGPSLDDDLAFVHENQDNAIIVSCGSALKALYANNIVPDFHVELERTAHVTHWIKNSSDGEGFERFLKKITLIAMSQVHPEVFRMFGKAGQMPKDTETGSLMIRKLFADHGVPLIGRVAPSCVHTGFTAAVLLGFRDIYLFGTDMGFKSAERHHSKHSSYEDLNEDAKKEFGFENKKLVEFEANFGDDVIYSSMFLPLFKKNLEGLIYGWKESLQGDLKIVNCSDGALIEGAEPIRSCDLDINSSLRNKKGLVDDLYTSYFSFTPSEADVEKIHVQLEDAYNKVDQMCEWLRAQLREVETVMEGAQVVDDLSFKFHREFESVGLDLEDSWLYSIFDGSLLYCLSMVQSTLFLPVDEEPRVSAFNEMIKVLDVMFSEIASDFRENALNIDKEEYYNFF